MPWSDLEHKAPVERLEEHRENAATLSKHYARTFETDDGQKVLEHLVNSFIMDSDVGFEATNIHYEAAYKDGEAGVVKFILNQIKRASIL